MVGIGTTYIICGKLKFTVANLVCSPLLGGAIGNLIDRGIFYGVIFEL